jgi:hypothetical protein
MTWDEEPAFVEVTWEEALEIIDGLRGHEIAVRLSWRNRAGAAVLCGVAGALAIEDSPRGVVAVVPVGAGESSLLGKPGIRLSRADFSGGGHSRADLSGGGHMSSAMILLFRDGIGLEIYRENAVPYDAAEAP